MTTEINARIRDLVSGTQPTRVLDARTALPGGLQAWDLETHGFCFVDFTTSRLPLPRPPADGVWSLELINEVYGPQMAEACRVLTGADRGFLYQYIKRGTDENSLDDATRCVHSDFGPNAPPALRDALTQQFGVPEEEAQNSDILMLNVWHPRFNPAYKTPLALLDWTSLGGPGGSGFRPVEVPMITMLSMWTNMDSTHNKAFLQGQFQKPKDAGSKSSGDGKFEKKKADGSAASYVHGPLYSPNHRWVYSPDMKETEAWFFKQYDTRPGVPTCCFHTAIDDPFHLKDPTKPGRSSLELRILLSFKKSGPGRVAKL